MTKVRLPVISGMEAARAFESAGWNRTTKKVGGRVKTTMADERSTDALEDDDLKPINAPIGIYTNFVQVSQTLDEFMFEFGTKVSEKVVALHTKLISSPTHTKRLLRVLKLVVERYEATHGPIPDREAASAREQADARRE